MNLKILSMRIGYGYPKEYGCLGGISLSRFGHPPAQHSGVHGII